MQQNTSSLRDNEISVSGSSTVTTPSNLDSNSTSQTEFERDARPLTQSRILESHKRLTITGESTGANHSTQRKSLAIRNLKSHCLRSLEAAKCLVAACKADEFMDQFEHGNELTKELNLMWENRDGREKNWGKLLNFLQAALSSVEFDTILVDVAESILSVVEMLAQATIDNEDILNAKRRLTNAGLDHWAAISTKQCNE